MGVENRGTGNSNLMTAPGIYGICSIWYVCFVCIMHIPTLVCEKQLVG